LFEYWKNQHSARGFVPGGMFVKDDFIYVPIPKNSSSYIGQMLLKNGWGVGNFLTTDLSKKKIIVLLRNPTDRWLSGMAQYMCSTLLKNDRTSSDIINNWNTVTQDLIFDRVIFDDHTEKQVYFINSIPRENCVFFDGANQPEQTIKNYLASQGIDLNTDVNLDRNQTQGNDHKEILVNFLRSRIIENPNLANKLTNTYQEDYTLWNATILPASN
jgi:hypothetical protein